MSAITIVGLSRATTQTTTSHLREIDAPAAITNPLEKSDPKEVKIESANPYHQGMQILAANLLRNKLLSRSAPALLSPYGLSEAEEKKANEEKVALQAIEIETKINLLKSFEDFKSLMLQAFKIKDSDLAFAIFSKGMTVLSNFEDRYKLFQWFICNYPDSNPGAKRKRLKEVFNILVLKNIPTKNFVTYAIAYFKQEKDLDTVEIIEELFPQKFQKKFPRIEY